MKSVLISIRPEWVEKIASGKKTIEVRKTAPKEVPFKAYIYCTKAKSQWRYSDYEGAYENSNGEIVYAQKHIIGEFICDKVFLLHPYAYDGGSADLERRKFIQTFEGNSKHNEILSVTCLSQDKMFDYIGVGNYGYGWHISDLKLYDKPKELNEFYAHKKVKGGCENCVYYRIPTLKFCQDCMSGKSPKKYLTRPPQSWMYVEELCKEQN